MPRLEWPEFKFGPLNLWVMPKHSVLIGHISKWYGSNHPDLWEKDMDVRDWGISKLFSGRRFIPRPVNTSWDDVIDDIIHREAVGATKYGKYLTVDTDEDMLQHAYEEALDMVVYLKTLINQREERDNK